MKIPANKSSVFDNEIWLNSWYYEAADITCLHGIIVEVVLEYEDVPAATHTFAGQSITPLRLSRICFKMENHEFETLRDLKKALRLKAFL